MTAIDDKRLNEMIAGMKLYADIPYGVKINEFSAKDLYSAMVELRELRASRRWVPVSERLPEYGTRVIVCTSNGWVTEMRYYGWWCYGMGDYEQKIYNVTHWQLPPPQPGTEEK